MLAVVGSVSMAGTGHAGTAPARQNGRIGYIDSVDGGWATSNPDGSDRQTVTLSGPGLPADAKPLWLKYSPDGTKAVVSIDNYTGNYWLVDAGGHVIRQLPVPPGGLNGIAWSPDGERLYSSSALAVQQPGAPLPPPVRVVVLELGGSQWSEVPGQPAGCDDKEPTASPDGRLVFVADCATSPNSTSSQLVELDPGAAARVLPVGGSDPQFSPDGSRLSVVIGTTDGHFKLAVMAMPPSQAVVPPVIAAVGMPQGSDEVTAWSPDGTQIEFVDAEQAAGGRVADSLHVVDARVGGADHVVVTKTVMSGTGLFSPSWQAGPVVAATPRILDRIGGADRVATAVDASQWSYKAAGAGGRQANVAVLSRDDQFADALAGNALAAQKRGPLLLTGKTALDPRVAAELKRVLAPGADVYVLGGSDALNPSVDQAVRALGLVPRRLAGTTRFGTAVAIAKEIAPGGPHTVMVATGADFPDALTAGTAASQDLAGGVVVLSDNGALPAETKAYLGGVDPRKTDVYGVGGQGVAALASGLPAWRGLVTPLAGGDRYATAYAVAHSRLFGLDAQVTMAGVATGGAWPDALAGGAMLGVQHGPLLLTGPAGLTGDEIGVLKAGHLSGLAVFGGIAAVPEAAAVQAGDATFGAGAWSEAVDRKAPALP